MPIWKYLFIYNKNKKELQFNKIKQTKFEENLKCDF